MKSIRKFVKLPAVVVLPILFDPLGRKMLIARDHDAQKTSPTTSPSISWSKPSQPCCRSAAASASAGKASKGCVANSKLHAGSGCRIHQETWAMVARTSTGHPRIRWRDQEHSRRQVASLGKPRDWDQ